MSQKIYSIAFIAVLGGFLVGYDTAVISGAVESLNRYFNFPKGLPQRIPGIRNPARTEFHVLVKI